MLETGLLAVAAYDAIGFVVAILFLAFGLGRVDVAAKDTGLFFRLIILPGIVLLWPFILWRWLSGRQINRDIHAGEVS